MSDNTLEGATPVENAEAASREDRPAIHLELTAEEQEVLRDVLDNYLSDLRMEIVDTDSSEFKKMLRHRKAVLVKIHEALQATEGSTGATPVAQSLP